MVFRVDPSGRVTVFFERGREPTREEEISLRRQIEAVFGAGRSQGSER